MKDAPFVFMMEYAGEVAYAESHEGYSEPARPVRKNRPEEIKVFLRFGMQYPIVDYLDEYRESAKRAASYIAIEYDKEHIQLVGIGTSGAVSMVLLHDAIKEANPTIRVDIVLLRKDKENTHRRMFSRPLEEVPILIVDDHISSGDTMSNIGDILIKAGRMDGPKRGAISYVEAVVAAKAIASENDGDYDPYTTFPNLKYILH